MKKSTLVVFAWSQEIQDKKIYEELEKWLKTFLEENKSSIDRILFWWQNDWVMWLVYKTAQEIWITIKWYSIEKYRKYDEWNWVDLDFFSDDYSRIQAFTWDGDIFLALPWWEWTIREISFVADNIWIDEWKYMFISHLFEDYVNLLDSLKLKKMLAPHDLEIKKITDISTIRI